MKRIILGGLVAAALATAGCEVHTAPVPVSVGMEYDVGPDITFYDHGWYNGNYWVWRDHNGHEFREERAIHERRAARLHADREHHEEHHEHEGR